MLVVALALASPNAFADVPPAEDALDPLRERFREGLEKYRAGAFAEAIVIWQKIYRDLGPEKGYRLAFNIARAYDAYDDAIRAAESYEAYVRETSRRREAGETLEAVVAKQEHDAEARLAELRKTQGRIRIDGARTSVVKIDDGEERLVPRAGLVVYVTPGRQHVVRFDPGAQDEHRVEVPVALGELVELAEPAHAVSVVQVPTPRREERAARPFDALVLYAAAGVSLASTLVPILLFTNASAIHDDYDSAAARASARRLTGDLAGYDAARIEGLRLASDYDSARGTAHLSLAVPIVLGAATAGLTAYYFLARKNPSLATAIRF